MLEGPRQRLAALADRMTLAQQIALTMGALFVLSLAVVAIVAATLSREAAVARIKAEMEETALTFAGRLEQEMRERVADLTLLAASAQMRGLWDGDPAQLRTALEELARSMGHEAWIGFVRPDGTVTAATLGSHEQESVAAEPWFREALDGPTFRDLEMEQPQAAPLHAPQNTPQNTPSDAAAPEALHRPGALLALPVHADGGRTAGALVAHLSLTDEDALRQALIGDSPDDPNEVWLLSRDGHMLMGPKPDSRPYDAADIADFLARKAGTLEEGSGAGAVLTGFAVADGDAHAPFIDWIVVARQPAWSAFAEARRITLIILGAGLGALVVSLLAARLIARRIAGPLERLSQVADQMGRDTRTDILPRVRGSREVIQLSGALRALLRRAGAAEARIDAQSAQHAKDLGALRALADTDPLTGLLNRRAFQAAAALAFGGSRATDTVGVLMIDIDHFKRINDTFGHAAGDAVLAAVGRVISGLVREHDKAARFGGEEFVVLSVDVTAEEIARLAERLRTGIAGAAIPFEGRDVSVTASVGATLACALDRDLDDVIERADMALYAAKRSGRNRTELQLALARLTA